MLRVLMLFMSALLSVGIPHTANIAVSCYLDDKPITGLNVTLYYVGDVKDGHVAWNDDYIGMPDVNIASSEDLHSCAMKVKERIDGQMYEPDYTSSLSDGKAAFKNIRGGVYLLSSDVQQSEGLQYYVIPVLLFVEDKLEVELKLNVTNIPHDNVQITVMKEWKLSDGSSAIPITVGLQHDGITVDTVELNEDNKWSYTWKDLDPSYIWTVYEISKLENFVSELQRDGDVITITNTSIDYLIVQPQTGLYTESARSGYIMLSIAVVTLIVLSVKIREKSHEKKKE